MRTHPTPLPHNPRLTLSLLPAVLLLAALAAIGVRAATLTTLSLDPKWVVAGTKQGADYGYAVAPAGDVDRDGYSDFMVGAPKDLLDNQGVVYLYPGGPAGAFTDPLWTGASGQKGSQYGSALASGDINQDGYSDLLIGAPKYDTAEGAVYLYYGSRNGPADDFTFRLIGTENDAEFGHAVAAVDANCDGFDDLLVGAHHSAVGYTGAGTAYLYYGSTAGPAETPAWQVSGGQPGANLGAALAAAGDINADGCQDFVIGAPFYTDGEEHEGAVFVFYGSQDGPAAEPALILQANREDGNFGYALAGAGDVNGDGFDDVLVGAPESEDGLGSEGLALVYHGTAQGLYTSANWIAYGPQLSARFGSAVAGPGDVDQDGYDDVLVGAWRYDNDQPDEGFTFLYRGSTNGPEDTAAWTAEGDKAEATFGYAVAAAGDLNRDGCQDILVGAPDFRLDETILGQAYAYHGVAATGECIAPPYTLHLPLIKR